MPETKYSNAQLVTLVTSRVLIGWHFLYEGGIKLMNPDWSSMGYLLDSQGWFKNVFRWMTENEFFLDALDMLTQWSLVLIGLGLILGLFERLSTILGILLLAMFYLSHPPFIGAEYMIPSEGSYFFVNKNLIELAFLVVLFLYPTSRSIGIDRLIFRRNG